MADTDGGDGRPSVKPGQRIYDDEGNELGIVRGFTEEGFQVSVGDTVDRSDHEVDPGQEFGEGYPMWRCSVCGEMGDLEGGDPETCPNCGTGAEDLYAWLED